MSADLVLEPANPSDLAGIERLLAANQLPTDGVGQCLDSAIVVRDKGRVIACAALETYQSGVLLRSVAVDQSFRGRGLGKRVIGAALALARAGDARTAYLLTTTAAGFFSRFGFERIDRPDVPHDVQPSIEFTSACPSSATVMRADLRSVDQVGQVSQVRRVGHGPVRPT